MKNEHSRERCWANVEFAAPLPPRPEISHVLFDFDGTLSLVREGWPDIMLGLFLDCLPRSPGETGAELRPALVEDIMRLTGKPTIDQMILLAEKIRQRGGTPHDPEWYKERFLERLERHTGARRAGLQSRELAAESLLVHQVRPLLEHLRGLGLRLYLASGTDDVAVKHEADLLDLTRYFGPHIYGAHADAAKFSKPLVISRMLRDDRIPGTQLLGFGDGFAEIEAVKAVGGIAVAVASDEANNGSGQVDPRKRARLLQVGADIIIPDYREAIGLVDYLLGKMNNSTFPNEARNF
ncbi:MAG TPA: HAD family hydrolase [Pirellulales bacterium]|nr:HAD family hydrolase [Pirellulales bacterium]